MDMLVLNLITSTTVLSFWMVCVVLWQSGKTPRFLVLDTLSLLINAIDVTCNWANEILRFTPAQLFFFCVVVQIGKRV